MNDPCLRKINGKTYFLGALFAVEASSLMRGLAFRYEDAVFRQDGFRLAHSHCCSAARRIALLGERKEFSCVPVWAF